MYSKRKKPCAIKSGTKTQLIAGYPYTKPRIARVDSLWLVAWQEGKNVVAQRVSTTGPIVVGAKIAIDAPATGSSTLQALGTDGTSWLALWRQVQSNNKTDLLARHIHTNGSMTTPVNLTKSTGATDMMASMVHTVGSTYLVTWLAQTFSCASCNITNVGEVKAMLVDAKTPSITAGTPLTVFAKTGILGTAASYDPVNKDYIAAVSNGDIKVQRFGPHPVTGAWRLEEGNPRYITSATNTQQHPHAAFGGEHHLIVWSDARASTGTDIYAARYR